MSQNNPEALFPVEHEISFERATDAPCPFGETEFCELIEKILDFEDVRRPCVVSVLLVDEDEMRETNASWRGVDTPTDVISIECERPDDPDLELHEPCSLGDLIFAPSYIERQAAYFGTTFADELRLLCAHGILHLLGYDHRDEQEALAMEAHTLQLLQSLSCDKPFDQLQLTRHREESAL